MSWEAVDWVLKHSPTTGTDRLVLIAIANRSGDHELDAEYNAWTAWPGLERITHEANLKSKRTTQAAIARLVEAEALTRFKNKGGSGRRDRRPNLYVIEVSRGVYPCCIPCSFCDAYGVQDDASRGARFDDGVQDDAATGCTGVAPKQSLEQSTERSSSNERADFEIFSDPKLDTVTNLQPAMLAFAEQWKQQGPLVVRRRMELAGWADSQIDETVELVFAMAGT